MQNNKALRERADRHVARVMRIASSKTAWDTK